MQTAEQLVPTVEETGDRHVYWVHSRSQKIPRQVDMEKRSGLGECNCPDFRYHKNGDCWHLQQVRKFLAIRKVQETMPQQQK